MRITQIMRDHWGMSVAAFLGVGTVFTVYPPFASGYYGPFYLGLAVILAMFLLFVAFMVDEHVWEGDDGRLVGYLVLHLIVAGLVGALPGALIGYWLGHGPFFVFVARRLFG